MTSAAEATTLIHQTMPLCETLGITALEFTPTRVRLSLDWGSQLCTSGGLLHGGASWPSPTRPVLPVPFSTFRKGQRERSTIESKSNFLGGISEGEVLAAATPLHVGSTTIVIETEVTNNDRLVAKVTQTQAVLRPR